MRNRWLRVKSAVLVSLLFLAGCVGMHPANEETPRIYLLEGQFEKSGQVSMIPLSLLVSQPHATPGSETTRMAYVRHPHEIEYFTRNQWAEPPSRMIWPLLVSALEQNSGYRMVVPALGLVKGDVRLDLEILTLQQEFLSTPSRIHIKLRAQLIDINTYKAIATQTFEAYENAPSEDPHGGVIAANRALKPLLQQIAKFASYGGKLTEQKKLTK